jgi:hypothetical protein
MRQFLFVVVGAMLVAAPGNAAQRSDRFDALRKIATGIGSVSGAASVCREISWPRMKALTDEFADLLKTSVTDNAEYSSIQQAYDQSSVEGQLAVTSRQVDCGAAVRDLADLERAVASRPPAAVTTGAAPPAARVTTGAAFPAGRAVSEAVARAARSRGLSAHKTDARAASDPQKIKTSPAPRAPYWEHDHRRASGGDHARPPLGYGIDAMGGDPGGCTDGDFRFPPLS